MKLVGLESIALFTNFILTTSSGKHLEDVSQSNIISLMYKLITSAKDSDDLSIGFDRNRDRRKQELTKNKVSEVNFMLELCSKMSLDLQNTKKKILMALVRN